MEKVIIYIAIAIAYYLYTNWKKFNSSKQNSRPAPSNKQNYPPKEFPSPKKESPKLPPQKAPKTLEDLLREFNPEVAPVEKPVKNQPVSMEKTEMVVDNYVEEAEIASKKKRKNYEVEPEVVLLTDNRFLPYSESGKSKNKYAALLKNTSSVKDAFVLSEILNKKY